MRYYNLIQSTKTWFFSPVFCMDMHSSTRSISDYAGLISFEQKLQFFVEIK